MLSFPRILINIFKNGDSPQNKIKPLKKLLKDFMKMVMPQNIMPLLLHLMLNSY